MQTMFPKPETAHITGLILAGGLARRLDGRDKGLISLGNRYLIEYVIERLRPQSGEILINANRNQAAYQQFGCPVIADRLPDFAGPLAGLLTGLEHMRHDWLVSAPCDNPWLPANLVEQLVQAVHAQQSPLAVASCRGELQPVYCLLHRSLQASLAAYLATGQHKVRDWIRQQKHCVVEFADAHAFENINTPQQLVEAEKHL